MSLYNKKARLIFYILPIILMADLLYLTIIPVEETYSGEYSNLFHDENQNVAVRLPIQQTEQLYYFTGYKDNDFLKNIEASLTIARNFQDYKSVIARNFNILLPTICFGVIAFYLGYCIRRKKQQISIMAISIGGHAPPKILSIYHTT